MTPNKSDNDKPVLAELMLHTNAYMSGTGASLNEELSLTTISCPSGTTTLDGIKWDSGDEDGDAVSTSLSSSLPFRCEHTSYGNPFECHNSGIAFPCRACVLMSGQGSLLWQIHNYFKSCGLHPVPLADLLRGVRDSQLFRCSPFQWRPDVKPLCDIFASSFDPSGEEEEEEEEEVVVQIGIFPVEIVHAEVGFSNLVALCLGSCQQQVPGSGADWDQGTLGKLKRFTPSSGTVKDVCAWKRDGWGQRDGVQFGPQWTSPADQSGNIPNWAAEVRNGELSKLTEFFNKHTELTFCIVALLDARPPRDITESAS